MAAPPASTVAKSSSTKASPVAIALHVEDRREEETISSVPLQDCGSGMSWSECLPEFPRFSCMQRVGEPNAGGGVPEVEFQHRSPSVSPSPAKEKKSRNSGERERKLLSLGTPGMRRGSPRFREKAEYLIALSNLSEKKACEMARRRLLELDQAMLTKKMLRSVVIPKSNSPEVEMGGVRKRKLDSSRESKLPEISPPRKRSRSCKEKKSCMNTPSIERLDRLCLSPCSNEIGDGKGKSSAPDTVEVENSTEDDVSLPCWSLAKISGEKILRRTRRSLSAAMASEDPAVNSCAAKPEQKEKPIKSRSRTRASCGAKENDDGELIMGKEYKRSFFIGEPIPEAEARQRWPWRYELENRGDKGEMSAANHDEEDELILNVECHYAQAQINGCVFEIGDCAYIRGENGEKHIGRIIEFFQTIDQEYCRVQWFYKAEDTVMRGQTSFHDKRRVFSSNIMNDNLLECVISKLKIVPVTCKINSKPHISAPYDYYYDMEYCLEYSTFHAMATEGHALSPPSYNPATVSISSASFSESVQTCELSNKESSLLDLYSGCGAMSTGLCFGAKMSGVDLVTRWAVDIDSDACESLKMNHPKTQVRNESAENFLELLKQWEKLCKRYKDDSGERKQLSTRKSAIVGHNYNKRSVPNDEEFEVERLLDICFGAPEKSGKKGLKFKVRWKGCDSDEDTWEPIERLRNYPEHICDFVTNGFKTKILPLPGDVDVICGGPPCQGISGYNHFRSVDNPFGDERNRQLLIFMDIVKFLRPKYVLMENVTDILKFDKGSLGRSALSRLVHMNYQARVGIMAAGCYGLPQFRLRVFFWGAHPSEDLPQFPLPSHDVVMRYWPPPEFERNVVAYDEGQPRNLQDAVVLRDALSDLPTVGNDSCKEKIAYGGPPETDFQVYIRSIKCDKMSGTAAVKKKVFLYDHLPLPLNEDDYIRVCHVPRKKGANFRDLPGIVVDCGHVVRRDPKCGNATLPSGKPMVPDYALTYKQGKSKRPFGRLWWDETVPTILTVPDCHNQVMLHPEQDRVLTVRECARIQGFPDQHRFSGTVKKRYRQIGNAVPIPVAKALGYALGMASRKLAGKEPLLQLPPNFAYSHTP